MTDDPNDAFFRRQDNERRAVALRDKHLRGERLTAQELRHVVVNDCERFEREIFAAMADARTRSGRTHSVAYTQGSADGIRAAVRMLIGEMARDRLANIQERQQLRDRIDALEASKQQSPMKLVV